MTYSSDRIIQSSLRIGAGTALLFMLVWLLAAQASRTAYAAPLRQGWIDLMATADPQRDAVAGRWMRSGSALRVDVHPGARLAFGWKPPAQYDLEVVFTRESGEHSVSLIFVAGGRQASFDIDGWGEHRTGIQTVGGQDLRVSPAHSASLAIVNGKRTTALLRVRANSVDALVDGRPVARYMGNGADLGLLDVWRLPRGEAIGLGAWASATVFHSVQVRPLTDEAAARNSAQLSAPLSAPTTTAGKSDLPDDLTLLSDEFESAGSLRNWQSIRAQEGGTADPLQVAEVGGAQAGWLRLVPYASTWYEDYRGVLRFKEVAGDFVATTRVSARNRARNGPPGSSFSLAGLMVRTPRPELSSGTAWRPGDENYVFLSVGAAREPGRFAYEVKTTRASASTLEITPAPDGDAWLRVARVGPHLILLRRDAATGWRIHHRYYRPDMLDRLQVGMTVYTDYAHASRVSAQEHNRTVIRDGAPDLDARFDYFRFARPHVPRTHQGAALSDARRVSDAELLLWLGADNQ